jgi:hypothetical protein
VPVPKTRPRIANLSGAGTETREGGVFKPFLHARYELPIVDVKEVLGCTNPDNKNPRFAGILEPSDGLEPSTPSLPWRFRGGTGGHRRALATTFFLQIESSRRVASARACPRVPSLMYPSRTHAVLSVYQTANEPSASLTLLFPWTAAVCPRGGTIAEGETPGWRARDPDAQRAGRIAKRSGGCRTTASVERVIRAAVPAAGWGVRGRVGCAS